MNRSRMLRRLVLAATVLGLSVATFAQDALVVNAKTTRLRLENAHVRVFEATLRPGDQEKPHSHPASIVYILSGGKIRNHAADGKITESEVKAGDVVYRDPLTHWAENIGTTPVHLIVVELKDEK